MCLYPKLILNRKYIPNAKNKGNPPPLADERVKYVPIGCGKCMECRRQRKRNWQVRLHEEVSQDKSGKFVTLSFSDESLEDLTSDVLMENGTLEGYDIDNAVATLATRRFLERWRKRTGRSVKHWIVTEIGQKNTERVHLHGIIFTNDLPSLRETWQYGNVWIGDYVSEKTVNYIVKYIHKTDLKHPNYQPKILTSSGIGSNYMNKGNKRLNEFRGTETREYYTTRQGIKLPLPIYYRNKIYNEHQREQLWINLLDKGVRYVNGYKIDVSKSLDEYNAVVEQERRLNKLLGYGDDSKNWNKIKYEKQQRILQRISRLNKINQPAINNNNEETKRIHKRRNKQLQETKNGDDLLHNNCDDFIVNRLQIIKSKFESDKDDRIQQREEMKSIVYRGEHLSTKVLVIDNDTQTRIIWKN